MKRKIVVLTLMLVSIAGMLVSCNNSKDDMEDAINQLVKTKWSYELTTPSSSSKYAKHWGSLDFVSGNTVFVTSGSEERYANNRLDGANRHNNRQEETYTGTYTYSKPELKITIPSEKTKAPAYIMIFHVNEKQGYMTLVGTENDSKLDEPIVYKRQ